MKLLLTTSRNGEKRHLLKIMSENKNLANIQCSY